MVRKGVKVVGKVGSTLIKNNVTRVKTIEPVQGAIASNMLVWAAIVGLTLTCKRWTLSSASAASVKEGASDNGEGH